MGEHTSGNLASKEFFIQHLAASKTHFERALDSKHTEFDDLYPYMTEHPQFFWYKRYVAWSELLTMVKLFQDLELDWSVHFTAKQVQFIEKKVMSGAVLDGWFETESHDMENQMNDRSGEESS